MADILHVVAAVIVRNGCVLACRRNLNLSAGGLWEFPGGKVEPGESPSEALAREVREELDVDVEIGELIHRGMTPVGAVGVDLSSYAVRLTDAVPTASTDHDRLRWLKREELNSVEWAQPDRPVVDVLAHWKEAG
ncbi:MAG TPA: (deoxy)nucleoside triphosphate pyrophosphohydrolase [Humibacter sp.]|nr:(deoxy)nucleoside triphosphate pyrophosphohydrolase [Humibacter sp.]